jgi:hypothetical protein
MGLSVLVAVSVSASAYADDAAAPAAPPATPPPAAMESGAPLFEGTHFAIAAAFNADTPALLLAPAFGPVLAAVGLAYEHNGNGLAPGVTDKDAAALILSAAYMIVNSRAIGLAMGPELDLTSTLAPGSAFDNNDFRVGWAFWYAPWKAPIAIGTAAQVAFVSNKGQSAVIRLVTPAVRIVFGFH